MVAPKHSIITVAFCNKTIGFCNKKRNIFCNKLLSHYVVKKLLYFVIIYVIFCNEGFIASTGILLVSEMSLRPM